MTETEVVEPITINPPVEKPRGILSEIVSQFATRDFWVGLARALFQEMVTSFLMAFGGTLVWYGKSRRNKDVVAVTGSATTGNVSQQAFGGGFSPNAGYSSTPPSYPAPPSHGDGRFPGFG